MDPGLESETMADQNGKAAPEKDKHLQTILQGPE